MTVTDIRSSKRSRPPKPPADWRQRAVFGRDGTSFKGCIANAMLVLEHDPAFVGRIRYDAFRDRIVVHGLPWRDDEHTWDDEDTGQLRAWFHRYENKYGMDVGRGDVDSAVSCVAHRNTFHPLRDWLSSLEWDGVARVDRLFVTYFCAPEDEYHRRAGLMWAISAVARAFEPGCKADYVPVLEGLTGRGKSSGIGALVGEDWFFDSGVDLSNLKAAYETIQGKWVVELAELDSYGRADVNRIKAFLTSQQDHYRAAYARHAVTRPRQVVFVGSTNEARYLKDPTGNRRFWPVRCSRVDLAAIRRDREQLWAEAVMCYRAGIRWWPDERFAELASGVQETRYQADVWEEPVAKWLGPRDGVTTFEVLTTCLGIDKGRISRADEMRCATVLQRVGLTAVRQHREGALRIRRYYRESAQMAGATSVKDVTEVVTEKQSSSRVPMPMSQPSQPIPEDHTGTNPISMASMRHNLQVAQVVTAEETTGVRRTHTLIEDAPDDDTDAPPWHWW